MDVFCDFLFDLSSYMLLCWSDYDKDVLLFLKTYDILDFLSYKS